MGGSPAFEVRPARARSTGRLTLASVGSIVLIVLTSAIGAALRACSSSISSQSTFEGGYRGVTLLWIFVRPSMAVEAARQFGTLSETQGPDGLPEAQFLAMLHHERISSRIIETGLLQTVVPNRRVAPRS